MARDTKMLQILIDGQTAIKKEMKKGFEDVGQRFDKIDGRIDKLGLQLASLEDDAPTVEEFDKLEGRVTKLEHRQFASN